MRKELDDKFASALPQIGGVIGKLDPHFTDFTPGVKFSGKSSRRSTPLNVYDRKAITIVSQQTFRVDMNIVKSMPYYVPTITDTGIPITPQQQEDARTAYYRFTDMAEEAESNRTVIQFPTTQDSRGRFYNSATDPSVRLSLRSPHMEGFLTDFEIETINGEINAKPYVYRVYDTEKMEYWEAHKQKVWLKPASAKNAWNVGYDQFMRNKVVFNDQSRFVIHTFSLTLKAIGL